MSGYDRPLTMPRADDRRRQTGARVMFDRETQGEAWYLARMLARRLSPWQAHILLVFAQCLLDEDALAAAEKAEKAGTR
jgi:hypothetical protein